MSVYESFNPDLIKERADRIGTGNKPTIGTLNTSIEAIGSFFVINFELVEVSLTVTDGAGAGSFAVFKLFDFIPGAVAFTGCRQNYTAFAEGSALTTGVGDAAFEIGVGTTAIAAAADGTLGNAVIENVGQAVTITNLAGTGAGTAVDYGRACIDGTSTAVDLNLNWSGTAATIDATSTIKVTGTISVSGVMLGDD